MEIGEFITFGGVDIYRPSRGTNITMRREAQNYILDRYTPRIYNDPRIMNDIIQQLFIFYNNKFNTYIRILAQDDFIRFILALYDKTSMINTIDNRRGLNHDEEEEWSRLGPVFRRTLKYIAERYTMLNGINRHVSDILYSYDDLSYLCISGEEIVSLYLQSDLALTVFPNSTTVELRNSNINDYFILIECQEEYNFRNDMNNDLLNRSRFIGMQSNMIQHNREAQNEVIGQAFLSSLGIEYKRLIDALEFIIFRTDPTNPSPVLVNKATVINTLARVNQITTEIIERGITGFLITQENMESEGRNVWNPRQEYRSYRRGFFELWHPDGQHICFSKSLAHECLEQLIHDVRFAKIPPEWSSNEIKQALDELSKIAGTWFEQIVLENLSSIGIAGKRSLRRGIGLGASRLAIPSDVGEIDFIGYSISEQILVLIECKFIKGGTEPKDFRGDISKFITNSNSYLRKFNKKIHWVRTNISAICNALSSYSDLPNNISSNIVKTAIITFYPSIVQCLINDHPVVSLTNFMLDYERTNSWPY